MGVQVEVGQCGRLPHSEARYEFRQFGDAAGSVGDGDEEATQPSVGRQPALQTPTEHRRVDVTAAQRNHDAAARTRQVTQTDPLDSPRVCSAYGSST